MANRIWTIVILLFLVAISFQLYLLRNSYPDVSICLDPEGRPLTTTIPCNVPRKPVAIFPYPEIRRSNRSQFVRNVCERLGFDTYSSSDRSIPDWWDLIWSTEYPFGKRYINNTFAKPTFNRKINHLPGIQFIAQKAMFNTEYGGSEYIPKTFRIPRQKEEFLREVQNGGKDRVWVGKNIHHRNVSLVSTDDLDLDKDYLIQEFITNQFLLYGHAINIGVLVLITSLNPLRVYAVESSWAFDASPKAFDPNNITDPATFISSSYCSTFPQMETVRKCEAISYRMRQAVETHMMMDLGIDPMKLKEVEKNVTAAIYDGIVKRKSLIDKALPGNTQRNSFFELMRWDFLLDEDLKVYLLEANMSPNIEGEHPQIKAKHTNCIYSLTKMLGFLHGSWSTNGMRNYDADFVDLKICYTPNCTDCTMKECQLCSACLSDELRTMLSATFLEHINRNKMRRIHPKFTAPSDASKYDPQQDTDLSLRDQVNHAWLRAKCIEDQYWCT